MIELDSNVSIKIIRSKNRRRTIGIQIDGNEIIIRAPEQTTDAEIRRLLKLRQQWIEAALKQTRATKPDHPITCGQLWFQGKSYRLTVLQSSEDQGVTMEASTILVRTLQPNPTTHQIQTILYEWYRTQAATWLPSRLNELAKTLQYRDFTVRIKEQKTRWGSCSARRNINLNWRLIMAPIEVAEYVMIHELCHLQEMNHSQKFWALVQQAMPNYEESRRWLRENARARLHW